jgi:hypothetical protein
MQHSQSKRRTTFTQQPAPCLKLLYLIFYYPPTPIFTPAPIPTSHPVIPSALGYAPVWFRRCCVGLSWMPAW